VSKKKPGATPLRIRDPSIQLCRSYHVCDLRRLASGYSEQHSRHPLHNPFPPKTKAQAPPTKRLPGFGEDAAPSRSEKRKARALGRDSNVGCGRLGKISQVESEYGRRCYG
jgi:hypothetical protein